jgi:hypothetical protein
MIFFGIVCGVSRHLSAAVFAVLAIPIVLAVHLTSYFIGKSDRNNIYNLGVTPRDTLAATEISLDEFLVKQDLDLNDLSLAFSGVEKSAPIYMFKINKYGNAEHLHAVIYAPQKQPETMKSLLAFNIGGLSSQLKKRNQTSAFFQPASEVVLTAEETKTFEKTARPRAYP